MFYQKPNQMIRQQTILLFLCMLSAGIHAARSQSGTLSSGLTEASNASGSMSFSLGLVFYTASENTSGSETQGLQHTYHVLVLGAQSPAVAFSAIAYPNPTEHLIHLDIDKEDWENLSYQLLDLNGRVIEERPILLRQSTIDMSKLKSAVYLLRLTDGYQEVKSFKITKK